MLRILVLALCALAALYLYLMGDWQGGSFGPRFDLARPGQEGALDLASGSGRTRIGPLSTSDEHLMRRQRSAIDRLARRHVGSPITGGGIDDLRILQELLDQRAVQPDQTFELQAMGVVLGDVMVAQLGFSWVAVEDELGRSRALRFGETDALVFPVTMISKRVEKDVRFTVEELYATAEATAARRGPLPY